MPIDYLTIFAPFGAAWKIIVEWWWIVVPAYLIFLYSEIWFDYFQRKEKEKKIWKTLMVSVPKEFTRGPNVMEQFFTAMWSTYGPSNLVDRYLKGEEQAHFSFELVGIEGNVRFIIHTPESYRDHIEAQIYAQYPEAEIQEIDDYSDLIPDDFLEKGWDTWGTEFQFTSGKKIKDKGKMRELRKHWKSDQKFFPEKWDIYTSLKNVFPLRTYPAFEHQLSGLSADPMASMTEFLSRLKKGEMVWYQLMIKAADPGWGKVGETYIDDVQAQYQWNPESGGGGLMPKHVQDLLEAIGRKTGQVGFMAKYRFAYIAKKEVKSNDWGVAGAIGPIQQFNSDTMNGVKPNSSITTRINYFFKEFREKWRKNALIQAMKERDWDFGALPLILVPEELATMWHFPEPQVKAERIQKIRAKKAGAPTELPVAPKASRS